MSKLLTRIATIALSAAVSLAGVMPVSAIELPKIHAATAGGVAMVQHRGGEIFPHGGGHFGGHFDRGMMRGVGPGGGHVFIPRQGGSFGTHAFVPSGRIGSSGTHAFVPSGGIGSTGTHVFVPSGGVGSPPARVFGSPSVGVSRFEPGFRHFGSEARFNGFRGFREHHRGFRFHNGFWFPLAAFATGALVAGSLYENDVYPDETVIYGGYLSPSHVEWCLHRYRTYRVYDNTFQPYYGPRQQCVSPYM